MTLGFQSKSSLIAPHGGAIVNCSKNDALAIQRSAQSSKMPQIAITERTLCDIVCIVTGAFSPLKGFMNRVDHQTVCDSMRLQNGTIWPIPISLPVDKNATPAVQVGVTAKLINAAGDAVALIDVEDVYAVSHEDEAKLVYGTTDQKHPGVAAIFQAPTTYVGGPITLLRMPSSEFPAYALTPTEAREQFQKLGWRTIVGFQTRNPVHRAHEYLQKVALENVDGLFLHPLVGTTKDDDLPASVRMRCYTALIERYYPAGRALLGVYPAAMRYAGPREAVLHAIVRKNYGCSHFIVGRDHAGAGSYYGTYDAHRIFDDIEAELGMTILRFDNSFWCTACEGMATEKTCPHGDQSHVVLSGTKVRELLRSGQRPPREFSRPEIADILISALSEKTQAAV